MQLNAVTINSMLLNSVTGLCQHANIDCFLVLFGFLGVAMSVFFLELFLFNQTDYSQNAARSSVFLKAIHMPIHMFKHS